MSPTQLAPAPALTAADAMVSIPKLLAWDATRSEIEAFFDDDHVHAALLVHGDRLITVVERAELERADLARADPREFGHTLGRLAGRTVPPDTPLSTAMELMKEHGRRRLAVTDHHGDLLGLLCLKRSGNGFCTDQGVTDRARQRRTGR